jgi:hypothetical protein
MPVSIQVFPAERSGPVAAGGSYAVPSRFTAIIDDPDQPYAVALDIRVGVGGAEILTCQLSWRDWKQPGGVTPKGLREVRLGEALVQALDAARFEREEIAGGPLAGHFRLPGDDASTAYGGPGIRMDGTPNRGAPGRGRVMTNDHLENVAQVYRAAEASGAPVEAVRRQFFTNRATASRWIAQARDRGILERPAQRAKEGEQ